MSVGDWNSRLSLTTMTDLDFEVLGEIHTAKKQQK